MTTVEHAREELARAGLWDEDSDYGGMLADAVMELIDVFAAQGHSGFSAHRTIQLFKRLASHESLLPLTGEPDEWVVVGEGTKQNRRRSTVFVEDGIAYDIDAFAFRDRDGSTYGCWESRKRIRFPYAPSETKILPSWRRPFRRLVNRLAGIKRRTG